MTTARATISHGSTGLWSAMIEWPFGYRFVSGLTLSQLAARIDGVSRAIGRRIDVVRGTP